MQWAGVAAGAFEALRAWRAGPGKRARHGILGAACVGWALQGNFLQGRCGYHVGPGLLLCLGTLWGLLRPRPRNEKRCVLLLAAAGFCATPMPTWALLGIGAAIVAALMFDASRGAVLLLATATTAAVSGHGLLDRTRLALWPQCWFGADVPRLADALTQRKVVPGVFADHAELEQVADFLRRQGVRDREVDCFSLATMPLHVWLGLRPPHRHLMPTVSDALVPQLGNLMAAEIRRPQALRGCPGAGLPARRPVPCPTLLPGRTDGLPHLPLRSPRRA